MLLPGKFVPKPETRFERNVWIFVPDQFIVLFLGGLFVPGALCEYAFATGHFILGSLGVLGWLPLLWILLLEFHNSGRLRFWLSGPVVLCAHAFIGCWIVGWL